MDGQLACGTGATFCDSIAERVGGGWRSHRVPTSNQLWERALTSQIMKVDPSAYKTLTDLVSAETKGKGRVESMGTVGS